MNSQANIATIDAASGRAAAANPLSDVWGTSSTDVYAVGYDATILHYDGNVWSPLTGGAGHLYAVWSTPSSDAYAVGEAGAILRGSR